MTEKQSVKVMLSDAVPIPDDVLKNHWEIVKRLQSEALK